MERNHSQKASCRIHHYVIDEGVRTGELQDFRKITEKVWDFHACAEGQPQKGQGLDQEAHDTDVPGPQGQQPTELGVHDN